jgi:hypothetical protein
VCVKSEVDAICDTKHNKCLTHNVYGESLTSTFDKQVCNAEASGNIIIDKTYDQTNMSGGITRSNERLQIKVDPMLITTINDKTTQTTSYKKTQN